LYILIQAIFKVNEMYVDDRKIKEKTGIFDYL